MNKYTIETGLNNEMMPVIKCSPDFYNKLISECRKLVAVAMHHKHFEVMYPAIVILSTNPLLSEVDISQEDRIILESGK